MTARAYALAAGVLSVWTGVGHAQTPVGDPERGRAIVARLGCVACHVVPGHPGPHGRVGPALGGISEKVYIAGSLPNTRDNLAAWLIDPPALKPDTPMPRLGLTRADALDVSAYLLRLPARMRR